MNTLQKIILFWLITMVGMILHFNYNVSGIFYEIDIVSDRAEGIIPTSTHIIRALYYHLPILFILLLVYFKNRVIAALFVVTSFIYCITHILHLFGELLKPNVDPSQISLLFIVAVVSVFLGFEHLNYRRELKWIEQPN
tara:strand:+ start:76972 stop:77388 length:417 start_codon:yes stop_codon:yes gene_type:complete